ncbi:tyrosine-type recombinase/integrase [Deefgea salmonis]|uniref:Arm DNA-binding domain-containing protein n=1 Tax=Deefgea salmonis TaxID=2875502 RepID=A0ABS8BIR2_9NEIS|nr:integrase arm-type DNA-binding domain-containing protein [Deefgea salmonis]MCB5195509.1 Arm DNA-binding domain-containing protein [Deefgea salmonis]
MTKFTDVGIKALITGDIRFEGRADSIVAGLVLSFRKNDKVPRWLFRYSFAGTPRKMVIGNYGNMSLSEARARARELAARVQLGYDVQGEKAARIVEAVAAIEAERASITVNELAEEYLNREIIGRVKHPNIPINQYEKNIRPLIGALKIEAVTSLHVDDILEAVRKRGAPSIANKALRMLQNIFDYAIRRRMIAVNPAAAFRTKDAGGEMEARDRALSRTELALLFAAMK